MPLLLGAEEHTSELQSPCNLVCLFFLDRKSTRLNSSHLVISYAVFCLKKKKTANGVMWLFKRAPNLMQPLSRLPSAPDVALLDRRKPKPFFFFNDTATTEIYTLSLHDALPI